MVPNLGKSPHRVVIQPREKVGQRNGLMDAENLAYMSNGAKFSAGRLLLPAYNFSATVASVSSTNRLRAGESLKFWRLKHISIYRKVAYR